MKHQAHQVYRQTRPEFRTGDNQGDRHPTSILEIDDSERRRRHPTAKPLALCEWLVRSYSKPGDLVVDPYSGSGTTAAACLKNGRRFIGSESDPEIFERSVEFVKGIK